MKVVLDIKDNKAESLIDLLSNLPYVKIDTISDAKAEIIESIKRAVNEMNLVKKGKLKANNAEDFLNGL
jgi:hypothetical protein